MKTFRYPFYILYRVWFYLIVLLVTILLAPFLFFSILKDTWYAQFYKIARIWGKLILWGIGCYYVVEQEQELDFQKSYMFIANHTSMTDIMLMFAIVKNPFVFVGKKELANIPLFGYLYKRTCILVDRSSAKSRHAVFLRAQKRIKNGLSICIFPEGGVPAETIDLDEFKDGAFRLAIHHKIPVVPITFFDNKKRFSFTFLSGCPGKMRVKVHHFLETEELTIADTKVLKARARTIILNSLKA